MCSEYNQNAPKNGFPSEEDFNFLEINQFTPFLLVILLPQGIHLSVQATNRIMSLPNTMIKHVP